MKSFEKIKVDLHNNYATIWLSQPEIRNALNPVIIKELVKGFEWIEKKDEIRVIVIRGNGGSFCAGADINWMKKSGEQGYRKNYADSNMLANCFKTIYHSKKVVINLVHGHAFGGALGFLGASDFNLATKDTKFGLTELRLGLVPSVIAPYLHARVRPVDIRYQIFTGKVFSASEAQNIGLIDYVCEDINEMKAKVNELVQGICSVSPVALAEEKELLRYFNRNLINSKNIKKTVKLITDMKMSEDANVRMSKFIEKR
ncbi:MAG: enoyl-CoA hydratase/isomerase family protein [Bacteroidales bacterium]|nr:MAG: enoyl-CoA hydratase/isomerase family protein [Bacteroidales bacterium]